MSTSPTQITDEVIYEERNTDGLDSQVSYLGRKYAEFQKWKNDVDTGGQTQYLRARNTIIGLLVVGVLAAIACTAIHYTGGFQHFANWAKDTWNNQIVPFFHRSITVGQGLAYIAAPMIGAAIIIAISVKYIKPAIEKAYEEYKREHPDYEVIS